VKQEYEVQLVRSVPLVKLVQQVSAETLVQQENQERASLERLVLLV